jgi:hypothetical protein
VVVEGAENERCFFAGLAGQGGGACKDEVISAAHAPNRGLGARREPVTVLPSFALVTRPRALSLRSHEASSSQKSCPRGPLFLKSCSDSRFFFFRETRITVQYHGGRIVLLFIESRETAARRIRGASN